MRRGLRETLPAEVQAAVAELHNASGVTEFVPYQIEDCFGRDIKAIFAERFAEAALKGLAGTALENVPLFGSLSQIGGVASIADEKRFLQAGHGTVHGVVNPALQGELHRAEACVNHQQQDALDPGQLSPEQRGNRQQQHHQEHHRQVQYQGGVHAPDRRVLGRLKG